MDKREFKNDVSEKVGLDNVRAIIEKSESFAIGGYPVSFWNYTSLGNCGQYMDEAEVEE